MNAHWANRLETRGIIVRGRQLTVEILVGRCLGRCCSGSAAYGRYVPEQLSRPFEVDRALSGSTHHCGYVWPPMSRPS